jgi:glycosyltransferase involved in cell wall biosynthesis
MKILFLSHFFYPSIGGIEIVSEILASEFFKAGEDVHLVTWSLDEGDKTYPFPVIRNPSNIDLIRQHKWADIVFENNPCFRLSWPALIYRRPTITSLHTWIRGVHGEISWFDRLKRLKLRLSSAVIAVSQVIKMDSYPKALVILNPFQSELFKLNDFSQNDRDFVFLGRLVSDKGVELAINAINILNQSVNKYNLTIIGDGPEMNKLVKIVNVSQLSEYINFTGSLSGDYLVNELRRHRFMLIPSLWKEPFGIVALEGLACGCIPIVSDGGGLPDAVGEAGLVFERGNLNSLVSTIQDLLTNPTLEMKLRKAALNKLEQHSPEIIAKKYLSVFRNTIYSS